MSRLALLLAAGAAAAALAGQASAKIVTITYTGTVISATDPGFFGSPGGKLNGDSFVWVTTLDTSKALVQIGPKLETLQGGLYSGPYFPLVSSSVTINGVSQTIGGDYLSDLWVNNNSPAYGFQELYLQSPASTMALESYTLAYPADVAGDFTSSADHGDGYLQLSEGGKSLYAPLTPTSVSIEVSGVPEPATWGMLLLGIGALGAALRVAARRNGRALAAA